MREASGIAVVYFLASFARADESFARQVGFALQAISDASADLERGDKFFNRLVLRIAFSSGDLLQNKHLRCYTVENSRRAKSTLSGVYLESVNLKDLTVYESSLEKCVLKKCSVSDVSMSRVSFNQCNIDLVAEKELDISDSILRGGTFFVGNNSGADAVDLESMQLRDWQLLRCVFERVKTKFSGKGLMVDVKFEARSTLSFDSGTYLEAGSDFCANDCVVSGRKMGRGGSAARTRQASWLAEGGSATFNNCELYGLWVTASEIVQMATESPKTKPRIVLHDCHGVVLTEDRQCFLDGQKLHRLSRAYPNLIFLVLAHFAELKKFSQDLSLHGKDCNLDTLHLRLSESWCAKVKMETRWSIERLKEIVDSFELKLSKMNDIVDQIKTLATS